MQPASGFLQAWRGDDAAERHAILAGLCSPQASIAPKYFYDRLGSRLFEAICELPEYYPTRTEAAIVAAHLPAIAEAAGEEVTLIDLGAGNCAKAARLFHGLKPRQYVPVDISVDFLRDAVAVLRQRHPGLAVLALGQDFSAGLELPSGVEAARRLFFYPGSSIGNFPRTEALAFLTRLRAAAGEDGALLIGVDLAKDPGQLLPAYDDPLGVTAAFNRNVLVHLNRLLGADFALDDWCHDCRYRAAQDDEDACIEMHLIARRALTVRWPGGERRFAEGEGIHTENSHKFTEASFRKMLEAAGFGRLRIWKDARDWFMVCHAQAC